MSLLKTIKTSIGAKTVMAVTGIMLMLFLVGHLLGNLQIFLGAEALNAYANKLQGLGKFLWVVRLGLLGVLMAHLTFAVKVWRQSKLARPIPYQNPASRTATAASKSMMMSGGVILLFVIYHLLHFTLTTTDPALAEARTNHDVYRMVITGFQNNLVSLFYIATQILLGLHLSHGAKSLFQTLGFKRNGGDCYDRFAIAFAVIIALGNISIPIAVMAGFIN